MANSVAVQISKPRSDLLDLGHNTYKYQSRIIWKVLYLSMLVISRIARVVFEDISIGKERYFEDGKTPVLNSSC